MVNENNLINLINDKKPIELVQELKDYEIKKSPLSVAARGKVINKSGSGYVSENKEGYGPMFQHQMQAQMQKQMPIEEKETIYNIFYASIERLEKYIEINYKKEFPDWENRKQIRRSSVRVTDVYQYLEKFESGLSHQLRLTAEMLENYATLEFRWELKREFDKWISATGINADSSPERLKFTLLEINQVFEGISGVLESYREKSNYLQGKKSYEFLSNEEQKEFGRQMIESFRQYQAPLQTDAERSLPSKEWRYEAGGDGSELKIKGKAVRINGKKVKVGFQHLIHTINDNSDNSSSSELWNGELTALDNVGGAEFARLTTSAGMSSGKGGWIASGGLDSTVFRVKPDEKSEVRLISGSLGGEAGIGAGGATLGYSANLDIISVKKEGFQMRAGFDAGSGATVGLGGVEVKAAGFGLSVGKKMGISLPFGEISINLEEACVVQ